MIVRLSRVAALGCSLLAALGAWAENPRALSGASVSAQPIVVTDDSGHRVRVGQPAVRIVTLAPHATELVYALGAGDALVGTMEGSDYPQAARAVPRIGGLNGASLEAVVARHPDLVIVWGGGNPPALIDRLRILGMPVFDSDPASLAQMAESLRALGQLTGRAAAGEQAARAVEQRANELRRTHRGLKPIPVFYQLWDQPLMTVGAKQIIGALIGECAGVAVPDIGALKSAVVSREAVLASAPQLIINGAGRASTDPLSQWQRYPWLPAVRHGQLRSMDPDLLQRPGPRLIDGAVQLCALIDQARAENER